ncbi:putative spermidine/putrescine transport system substrate-binding protein [Arthrobacter sp. 2762]
MPFSNNSLSLWRRVGLGAALAGLMLSSAACSSPENATQPKPSLVIASWGNPLSGATKTYLVDPFVAETGIEVKIVDAPGKYVANLESQKQANKIEWDLLDSTSGPDAYIAYDKGLIEKMPEDVKARILQSLPQSAVTEFGISWSALGYVSACSTRAVEKCPANTTEFFDTASFPGTRTSIATSPLVNLSLAEVAAGVPVKDLATHEIDLDRAFETLKKLKPSMGTWWSSGDQNMQVFASGEADMGISYSGRAYAVDKQGTPMTVSWDQGLYNPGFWNVVAGSPNSAASWQFIEWIAKHPEAEAKWAEALGYSVPNPKAFDFLPADVASKLADFPANREVLAALNYTWYVKNYKEVNDRWQEFLRG